MRESLVLAADVAVSILLPTFLLVYCNVCRGMDWGLVIV